MAKKIIINEAQAKMLMAESLKKELTEKDIEDKIKQAIKTDKDLEKKIKKIIADSVNVLFKALWQKTNFYQSEITR